ncbi:MBL fold metallo-hydrolase [Agrobacterium tumefaciens]|uniref:quorum-quenching N-acyl-homoserine lactonase n=1 Tax=Agrobacterium tumefaciens TaxID=358 RepID=A0A546Y0N2_AGRTU|nr:MBL fold metallo-hydrolase [Agrobacterium tumefaciens]TRB06554.1 MBL fold metallo-hydrolase [Agrobacterium tumefaciens]
MKPIFATSAFVRVHEPLVLRGGRRVNIRLPVRYGLVIHPKFGPVLIDTGYTFHSSQGVQRSRLLRLYGAMLRPELNDAGQPTSFLSAFGLTPADVCFVVVSHFHADHISGLSMFPNAQFIASDAAWYRLRNRSMFGNLRHGIFPELIPADFEDRMIGLSSLKRTSSLLTPVEGTDLFGDGTMIAIDLAGHADGHFGIFFATAHKPLFYGVDATWLLRAISEDRAPGYPARLVAINNAATRVSHRLLQHFLAARVELLLCHDPSPTAYDFTPGDGA